MRSTRLLPLLFALIPAACGDDIKFPDQVELPDPALNGVFPARAFTDRTLRVEISGDGTEFTGTPTVSFGADITVASVELSSPSTLFANISIAGAAAVGKRDVVVTNGGDPLTLTAAFDVQNPLEIVAAGPSLQGGLNQVVIINHDFENPFLGTLEVTGGPGVVIQIDETSQTESIAVGTVFIDGDATSGPVIVNDLFGEVISRGAELTVTPRAPTALTAPGKGPAFAAADVQLAASTAYFSFAGTPAMWRGTISIDSTTADPPILIWLPNGKWADARGFNSDDILPITATTTMNVVVFDGFATGGVFDIAVDDLHDLTGFVALAEVEDNDFFNDAAQLLPDAQDVTLFTGLLNTDDTGFDDILVNLEDGDQIHATTAGADTAVFVLFDDGFTPVDGNGFEANSFCCGNLVGLAANDDISEATLLFASDTTSDQLPAGQYIVEVIASFFPGDPYEMAITVIHNPQK